MIKKKLSKFINNNISLAISATLALTVLVGVSFCYYFLPILLNYAPGSINTEFDKEFSGGLTYFIQFVLIFFAVFTIGNTWLTIETRDFKNIKKYIKKTEINEIKNKLNKIKIKCMTLPQKFFLFIALIPPLGTFLVFCALNFLSIADFKVLFIVLITCLLVASLRISSIKKYIKISFSIFK